MSPGAISELECNGYDSSSGEIIEFNITTGKQLNLNTISIQPVIVDFVNDVSTLVHVYPTNSLISANSDFGVRLFVPNTNTVELLLGDIYTRLQELTSVDGNSPMIFFADGTMSLGIQTLDFSPGDRIFHLDSAIRLINPQPITIISQNQEFSPKNRRIYSAPKIAHIIREACTGISCQCQKNFLQYCGTDLRTLT